MISWIFSLAKWSLFAVMVLVLGHIVEWRDRTISDHIRSTLAHFEAPAQTARDASQKLSTEISSLPRRLRVEARRAEQFSKAERARLDSILSGQTRN